MRSQRETTVLRRGTQGALYACRVCVVYLIFLSTLNLNHNLSLSLSLNLILILISLTLTLTLTLTSFNFNAYPSSNPNLNPNPNLFMDLSTRIHGNQSSISPHLRMSTYFLSTYLSVCQVMELRPMKYKAEKSGDLFFCGCKVRGIRDRVRVRLICIFSVFLYLFLSLSSVSVFLYLLVFPFG
jgi:hypothetical protein